MRTIALLFCLTLVACASNEAPKAPMVKGEVEPTVSQMSRQEIINAVAECESAGLRAMTITTKRRINGYPSDVTVDVTCVPKYKLF